MAISTIKVMTSDGQELTLTLNTTTGKYEAQATAPSQTSGEHNANGPGVGESAKGKGYYDISVTATDQAGNKTTVNSTHETLGNNCRLYVKELTKPTVAFTYPTAGATIVSNKPAIRFTASDAGSGINPASGRLTIDNGTVQTITLSGSGSDYSGTYTPATTLADGSHTVTFYAVDYDGNQSATASVTFKIDTTPPTLTVSTPAEGMITNLAACRVSGTTNDATSSPVTVTIKLNNTDQGAVTVNDSGAFSKDITLTEGENTIIIRSTDSAGKYSEITRTVTLDTKAPIISNVELIEQHTNVGTIYTIRVTCEDP